MKQALTAMKVEFRDGFTILRICRGFIFCLGSFPVVVVTMIIFVCALNEGGGNPSLGIAKSVIAVAETYQPTSQSGMLSKHFSVCSFFPAAGTAQRVVPTMPLAKCHSATALVAADKVIAEIAHGITDSYWFLVAMGFAGLCFRKMYQIAQAGRYQYARSRSVAAYPDFLRHTELEARLGDGEGGAR